MLTAHYVISHKTMFKVLAITSFQKRTLAEGDEPAWEQLRKDLIGDKLVLALGGIGNVEIDAATLAADEIKVTGDPHTYYDNPYSYELAPSGNNPPTPGKGKPQTLQSLGTTVTAQLSNAGVLTVTLSATPNPSVADVIVFFENRTPVAGTINAGTNNNKTTTVSVGSVTPGTHYSVVVMVQGAATLVTRVKA